MLMENQCSTELTQEEFNVAYLVAHGKTYKQAAYQNGVTKFVVGDRLKRTYRKLGIFTRDQLPAALEREGYSDAPHRMPRMSDGQAPELRRDSRYY